MKGSPRLLGIVEAEIHGAEPELLLNRCGEAGLQLGQIRRTEPFTLTAQLRERDLPALRQLAAGCGCEVQVDAIRGGSRGRAVLRARAVLLCALVLVGAALLASSLFLWEIRVEGCETLTRGQVLRVLADCGVERGSFWPGMDPDLVRSKVLTALPQLQWMTVNVSGSRATVLVRERAEPPEEIPKGACADIVAGSAGVITETAVLRGHALVQPGDAVLEGETLVSGTVESLTAPPRRLWAMAEIRAETWHELTAVCPLETLREPDTGKSFGRVALQIGKKRWYLGRIGGKALDECGTIVHEYNVGLEGLFALPVKLLREERQAAGSDETELDRENEMKTALLRRLEASLDGEVLETAYSVERNEELLTVTLRARCRESIARTVEFAP